MFGCILTPDLIHFLPFTQFHLNTQFAISFKNLAVPLIWDCKTKDYFQAVSLEVDLLKNEQLLMLMDHWDQFILDIMSSIAKIFNSSKVNNRSLTTRFKWYLKNFTTASNILPKWGDVGELKCQVIFFSKTKTRFDFYIHLILQMCTLREADCSLYQRPYLTGGSKMYIILNVHEFNIAQLTKLDQTSPGPPVVCAPCLGGSAV